MSKPPTQYAAALALAIATVALTFVPPPAAAAEPPTAGPPGWLNASDFGASGSEYSTTAATTTGAKEVTVVDAGDFKPGQGVMLSECNPRLANSSLWGPRHVIAMGQPLKDKAEIRGYDGTQGDWLVLLLDVPERTTSFRWSEDLARTWQPTVPITGDWQPLRDGIEVRFNAHDWEKGYTVCFSARGQLVTTIEKIEGKVVTLRAAPTRTVGAAVLRHCDDAALQAAIDQALKERRSLHVPVGRYRLSRGLVVRNATSLTLEGANPVETVLDISEGEGACVTLAGGTEVTLRNFTMVGHSGFEARDQCGYLRTLGSSYFWGFGAKGCNAVSISSTERVLVENCHGRRMATECFVSGSRSRGTPDKPNAAHCKQTTYLRCSAIDCARNGFNDVMCGSENTSVLNCRIVDVGGCAWEGASRFVKFVGNYVRNAGPVAMGNLGPANHDETFPELGAGQHLVADNVFESTVPYGGYAIGANVGATQVLVTNNQFVNFGSSAVHIGGRSDQTHYPSANAVLSGNVFDMTQVDGKSVPRTAVDLDASDTLVSDNQVYVRGDCDPQVTGVRVLEPACNVTLHDNLIRNCGAGIVTGRASSRVGEVVDASTFLPSERAVLLDARKAPQCQGWGLAWLVNGRPTELSVVEAVTGAADPKTVKFTLKEPHQTKVGDRFELIPPAANWTFHDNTLADCQRPLVLDSYGGPTSVLRNNLVTRTSTVGVKQAVELHGRFSLLGNHLVGFDEDGCAALSLYPDPLGRPVPGRVRDNLFERCAQIVRESQQGLWEAYSATGNEFLECGAVPEGAAGAARRDSVAPVVAETAAPTPSVLIAARAIPAPTLDGSTDEWPWQDNARVVSIAQSPTGQPFVPPAGRLCAAWDAHHLYLAVRLAVPKGAKLRGGADFAACDGVEVSLRASDAKADSPIFVLWGSTDGSFQALPAGGAAPAQCESLQKAAHYAARVTPSEWTCEWQLPFAILGVDPKKTSSLQFNLGTHQSASGAWVAWRATAGAFYEVEGAGELVLAK
ncbi:MAG: hypothetical protein AUJ96_25410 [Armatimonadetes bacterium CG2_30_66_41]|nr:hypothetical protein [Armatimonadota bacterium]NDK11749.1 hypothetical protein [Armatimonadota bacterium]OIO96116.1 MAG: hypothetical protein AUJ96_25410 [Armatimonadetes bacterium CG2_30_66_41]